MIFALRRIGLCLLISLICSLPLQGAALANLDPPEEPVEIVEVGEDGTDSNVVLGSLLFGLPIVLIFTMLVNDFVAWKKEKKQRRLAGGTAIEVKNEEEVDCSECTCSASRFRPRDIKILNIKTVVVTGIQGQPLKPAPGTEFEGTPEELGAAANSGMLSGPATQQIEIAVGRAKMEAAAKISMKKIPYPPGDVACQDERCRCVNVASEPSHRQEDVSGKLTETFDIPEDGYFLPDGTQVISNYRITIEYQIKGDLETYPGECIKRLKIL